MDTIDRSVSHKRGSPGKPRRRGRGGCWARHGARRAGGPSHSPPTRRVTLAPARYTLHRDAVAGAGGRRLAAAGNLLGHSDAGLRHHLNCRGTEPFRHPEGTSGVCLQGYAGLVCAPARHLSALQQRRPRGDECQRHLARHDDPAGARHVRRRRAGSGLADLCSRRCPVPVSSKLGLARPITPDVNRWHVHDHRARWCRLVGEPVAPGH